METVSVRPHSQGGAFSRMRVAAGPALLAVACPILFLHVRYQPGVSIPFGSTELGIQLSDLAVLAVALFALWAGLRRGFRPLRGGLPIWVATVTLLAWITIESFRPFVLAHLVTAAKFAEYAVLAFSVPLLLRRRADFDLVFVSLTVWSVAATTVAVLQFFGVSIFSAWPAGSRQPSFLGHLDFAALSGMVLALGLVALLIAAPLARRSSVTVTALLSGGIGLALAGGSAGLIGIAPAALATVVVAWKRVGLSARRFGAAALVLALVAAGVLALRARDFDQLLRFVGAKHAQRTTNANVQTYAQHTLLAYVGWRIFLAHPLTGAGWQESSDKRGYGPVLRAVHKRFPKQPAIAFPSPAHPYGVQNAYVQALADLGVIGGLLWLGLFASGLVVAARAGARGSPALSAVALAWILLSMGLWIPQGLVAGLPLDALTWLGLGVAATAVPRA